jgi:hypothetical protein
MSVTISLRRRLTSAASIIKGTIGSRYLVSKAPPRKLNAIRWEPTRILTLKAAGPVRVRPTALKPLKPVARIEMQAHRESSIRPRCPNACQSRIGKATKNLDRVAVCRTLY